MVVLVLAVLAIIIPLSSGEAQAETYYVDTVGDFLDAVQHAKSGDSIVFRQDLDINLRSYTRRLSGSGPGQELYNGQWTFYNLSNMVIETTGNVTVTLRGFAIRFSGCDHITISGLNLDADVWIEGSDNIAVRGNTFLNGHMLWIRGGSADYTVVLNRFQDGGGLLVDDVRGGGFVRNNTVNGFHLTYYEFNFPSDLVREVFVQGDTVQHGQVVLVNSGHNMERIVLWNMNMTRARIGWVKFPIVISGSSKVVLMNITLDSGEVRIFNSSTIVLYKLRIKEGAMRVNVFNTNDFRVMDTKIEEGTAQNYMLPVVFYIEDSSDITLTKVNARLNDSYLLRVSDSRIVVVKDSNVTILKPRSASVLYLKNVTGVTVEGNNFKAEYTRGWGSQSPTFVSLLGVDNATVSGNNFTANVVESEGEHVRPVRDGTGVAIAEKSGSPSTLLNVSGNTFKNLSTGISIGNRGIRNTVIARNLFEGDKKAIYLGPNLQNLTIYCNVFKDSPLDASQSYGGSKVTIYMNAFLMNPPAKPFYQGRIRDTITNASLISPTPITYEYDSKDFTSRLGNYYSWHNNTDSDGNGIADNPIKLAEDRTYNPPRKVYDNYPIADPTILRICGAPLPINLTGGGGVGEGGGDSGGGGGTGAGGGTGGGGSGGPGTAPPPLYVAPESIVFPPLAPGEKASLVITIVNTGSDAVELTKVVFRSHSDVFTTNLSTPSMIPPGMSVEVEITYRPRAYTTYNTVLELRTNLTSQPQLEVTITAPTKQAPSLPTQTVENLKKRMEASKNLGTVISLLTGTVSNTTPGAGTGKADAAQVFGQLKQMEIDKLLKGINATPTTKTLDGNRDGKIDALDLVEYLATKGLMKTPPVTTKAFSEQLIKLLQRQYGQNLEEYPTSEGKLWILALLEKSQES